MSIRTSSTVPELSVTWDEVRTQLRALIVRRVGDPETAEDLVQEVLLRLSAAATGDEPIRNVPQWLGRVARNAIIDYYRTRRRLEPIEAAVHVVTAPEDLPALLAAKRDLLATLFIVSRVSLAPPDRRPQVVYESQEIPGLTIGVDRAPGGKCERCWIRSERVGEHAEHPTLCERCVPVVARRPA